MNDVLQTYGPPIAGALSLVVVTWLWRMGRKAQRILENVWKQLDPDGNCIVKQLDVRLETVERSVADLHRIVTELSADMVIRDDASRKTKL